MAKRKRRSFTPEFKADTVRLVREGGRTISAVARDLDLTETALREWVRQAAVDSGQSSSGALTTAERAELAQLRRDVRRLEMEREILKNYRIRHPIACWRETPSAISSRSRGARPSAYW